MRPPPAFAAVLLLMLSALVLGCDGGQTGTTAAPTPTATTPTALPSGQPSAAVQSRLEAVLDGLMADGVFGGRRLCPAYTADVTDQRVSVGFTLRNSTDPSYSGLNRTMTDVLQEYASWVAGYFGPNRELGAAYGSRAVQVDFTIYGVHLARYVYMPSTGGGTNGWSAVTFYVNPEIYISCIPPETIRVFAIFNDTANCSRFNGVTVYLGSFDANWNATWEPGDYLLELRALDNSTAYSKSHHITNEFLEYPGITRGIPIYASEISVPLDQLSYALAYHTRGTDGVVLGHSFYVKDPQNNCP